MNYVHHYRYLKYLKLESDAPDQVQMIRTLLGRIWKELILFKSQIFSLIAVCCYIGGITILSLKMLFGVFRKKIVDSYEPG